MPKHKATRFFYWNERTPNHKTMFLGKGDCPFSALYQGMVMDQRKEGERTYWGVFNETQRERWKPLLRWIASVIIFCFVYQDIASAYGPDFASTIVPQYRRSSSQPLRHPVTNQPLNLSFLWSSFSSFLMPQAMADDDDDGPKPQAPKPSAPPPAKVSSSPGGPSMPASTGNQGWGIQPEVASLIGMGMILSKAGPNGNMQWRFLGSAAPRVSQTGRNNVVANLNNPMIAQNRHVSPMSGRQVGSGHTAITMGGSTINGLNQWGQGHRAVATGGSHIEGLTQLGSGHTTIAAGGSRFDNVLQVGVNHTVVGRNSRYINIRQLGSLNRIDNTSTYLKNVTQTGIGHSISGNRNVRFHDVVSQTGALNRINNNRKVEFYKPVTQSGLANSIS
ncbi:MAG: hypothetical protein GF333_08070, partial [Candidatus Omnitrophica bacterium]|nr:hypothetical protein [Candidatus Omnitrophota bacterium]